MVTRLGIIGKHVQRSGRGLI